jgi:hypothetical protein
MTLSINFSIKNTKNYNYLLSLSCSSISYISLIIFIFFTLKVHLKYFYYPGEICYILSIKMKTEKMMSLLLITNIYVRMNMNKNIADSFDFILYKSIINLNMFSLRITREVMFYFCLFFVTPSPISPIFPSKKIIKEKQKQQQQIFNLFIYISLLLKLEKFLVSNGSSILLVVKSFSSV